MFRTFIGIPNQAIQFSPAIGAEHITSAEFDEDGKFTTDHPLIIEKFFHVYDSYPTDSNIQEVAQSTTVHSCKKCEFIAESRSTLMQHYKKDHPKE